MEPKWFGGILGGHAGIEADSGNIVSFVPHGKFHWFAKNTDQHSRFVIHDSANFYSILGKIAGPVKQAIVYIPLSSVQKQIFDSLTAAYMAATPYDYALFGMRCGAAAYDMLSAMHFFPTYHYRKTYRKIFYPKKLRKRLFKKARENGWTICRQAGSVTRKWEQD